MKVNSISRVGRNSSKHLGLTILALPGILLFFVFCYVPMFGLILPFKRYRFDQGLWGSAWAGLSNFEYLFKGDILFRVVSNTLLYNVVFIALGTVLTIIVALMLYELGKHAVKIYQTILFISYFISWVVAGYAFRALLDMDHGVFNKLLGAFGMEPILWYNDPQYWPYILVAAAVWKGVGYGAIIYYAALMGIDSEYYDAAKIDGASKFRQAISISLPMIKTIVILMVILQIGQIFYSDFGLFYNVTLNSTLLYPTTDVIETFVYRSLINMGDFGMSSAASMLQSVVGFLLVLLTNFIVKRVNEENALF